MRLLHTLLAGGVLGSAGCSALIAHNGLDLGTLHTREQVHERFGSPADALTPTGLPGEEFRTNQKIAEPARANGLAAGFRTSFGLQEVVCFPHELYLLTRRSVFGQKIRFIYDANGTVTGALLDGRIYPLAGKGGTEVRQATTANKS